jgi:hypothetical protein
MNEHVKQQTKRKGKINKESSSGRIQEMRPQPKVFLFIQTSQLPSQVMGLWKLIEVNGEKNIKEK